MPALSLVTRLDAALARWQRQSNEGEITQELAEFFDREGGRLRNPAAKRGPTAEARKALLADEQLHAHLRERVAETSDELGLYEVDARKLVLKADNLSSLPSEDEHFFPATVISKRENWLLKAKRLFLWQRHDALLCLDRLLGVASSLGSSRLLQDRLRFEKLMEAAHIFLLSPEPPNRQLPTRPDEEAASPSAVFPCVGTNLLDSIPRLISEASEARSKDPFRHACAYADATIAARILASLYSLFAISLHAKGNGAILPTGLEDSQSAAPAAGSGAPSSSLILLVRTIRGVSNSLYSALDHSDTNPQFEILWTLLMVLMTAIARPGKRKLVDFTAADGASGLGSGTDENEAAQADPMLVRLFKALALAESGSSATAAASAPAVALDLNTVLSSLEAEIFPDAPINAWRHKSAQGVVSLVLGLAFHGTARYLNAKNMKKAKAAAVALEQQEQQELAALGGGAGAGAGGGHYDSDAGDNEGAMIALGARSARGTSSGMSSSNVDGSGMGGDEAVEDNDEEVEDAASAEAARLLATKMRRYFRAAFAFKAIKFLCRILVAPSFAASPLVRARDSRLLKELQAGVVQALVRYDSDYNSNNSGHEHAGANGGNANSNNGGAVASEEAAEEGSGSSSDEFHQASSIVGRTRRYERLKRRVAMLKTRLQQQASSSANAAAAAGRYGGLGYTSRRQQQQQQQSEDTSSATTASMGSFLLRDLPVPVFSSSSSSSGSSSSQDGLTSSSSSVSADGSLSAGSGSAAMPDCLEDLLIFQTLLLRADPTLACGYWCLGGAAIESLSRPVSSSLSAAAAVREALPDRFGGGSRNSGFGDDDDDDPIEGRGVGTSPSSRAAGCLDPCFFLARMLRRLDAEEKQVERDIKSVRRSVLEAAAQAQERSRKAALALGLAFGGDLASIDPAASLAAAQAAAAEAQGLDPLAAVTSGDAAIDAAEADRLMPEQMRAACDEERNGFSELSALVSRFVSALAAGPMCADGVTCSDHLLSFMDNGYRYLRAGMLEALLRNLKREELMARAAAESAALAAQQEDRLAMQQDLEEEDEEDEEDGDGMQGEDGEPLDDENGDAADGGMRRTFRSHANDNNNAAFAANAGATAAAAAAITATEELTTAALERRNASLRLARLPSTCSRSFTLEALILLLAKTASELDSREQSLRSQYYTLRKQLRAYLEETQRNSAERASKLFGQYGNIEVSGAGTGDEDLDKEPAYPTSDPPAPDSLIARLQILIALASTPVSRSRLLSLRVKLPACAQEAVTAEHKLTAIQDALRSDGGGFGPGADEGVITRERLFRAWQRVSNEASVRGYAGVMAGGGMGMGMGAVDGPSAGLGLGGIDGSGETGLIHSLFHLLRLTVPTGVKAAIFTLLARLAQDRAAALAIRDKIEEHQVLATLTNPSAAGAASSSASGSSDGGGAFLPPSNLLVGSNASVQQELEVVETADRSYDASLAFATLLRTLYSVVPMHGLGTRIDRETGKKTYKRVPGLHPHLAFLIESLFLKADRRPYRENRPADLFKLQFGGLAMVRDLLSRYYVASPPPKAILNALALSKTDATLAAPSSSSSSLSSSAAPGASSGFAGGLFGSLFGSQRAQPGGAAASSAAAGANTNRALSARMPILAEFYSTTPTVGAGNKTTGASSLAGTSGLGGAGPAAMGLGVVVPPPGHPLLDFIKDAPRIYVESRVSSSSSAAGDETPTSSSSAGSVGGGFVAPPKSPGFEVMRRMLTSGDSLTSSLLSILEGSAAAYSSPSSFAGPVFNQLGAAGSYSAAHASQFGVNGVAESLELEAAEREDSASGQAILARAAKVDAANRHVFFLTRVILEQSGQLQQLQQAKDGVSVSSGVSGAALPELKPEQVTAEVAQASAQAALVAGCGLEITVTDFSAPNGIRRQPLSDEQLQACARLAEAKSNDAIKETLGAGQGFGGGNDDPLPWKEKVILCILSIIDAVLSKDNAFIAAVRSLGFGGDRPSSSSSTAGMRSGASSRNESTNDLMMVLASSSSSSASSSASSSIAGVGSTGTSLLPFAQILKRRNVIPAIAYLAGTTRRQEIGVLASRILYRLSIHHAGILSPHELVAQLMFPRLLEGGPTGSGGASSSNALVRAGGGLTFGQLVAATSTSSSSASSKAAAAAREAALEAERDNDRKRRVETAFAQSLRQRHQIIQRLVAALGDDESSEDNDEVEEIAAARERRVLVEMSAAAAGVQLSPSVLAAAAAAAAGLGAGGRGAAETGGGSSVEDVLALAAGYYAPQSLSSSAEGEIEDRGFLAGIDAGSEQLQQDQAFWFAAAAGQQNNYNPQAAGAAALLGAAALEYGQPGADGGFQALAEPENFYLAAPAVHGAQADARATRLLDDGVRALLNPADAVLAALQPPTLMGALGAADYSLLVGSSPSIAAGAAFLSAGTTTDPRFRLEAAHVPVRIGVDEMPFSVKQSIEGALKNVNGSSVSWGLEAYVNRKASAARRSILLELILRSLRMATAEAARAGVLLAASSGRSNARKAAASAAAAAAMAQQRKEEAASSSSSSSSVNPAAAQQDERLQLALGFGAGGSKATAALTAAALPKRGMTIAHLLLGIPSSMVSFAGAGSGGAPLGGPLTIPFDVVSCMHAVVLLASSDSRLPLISGADPVSGATMTTSVAATAVEGALTSPDFTMRRPRVAETATRLLSSLLEDPRTRAPTLDFLQTSNAYTGGDRRRFFLSRLLNIAPLLPEAVCPPAPLPALGLVAGGGDGLFAAQQPRVFAETTVQAGAAAAEETLAMSAIEGIVADDARKRGVAAAAAVAFNGVNAPGGPSALGAGAGAGAACFDNQQLQQQQMVPLFTRQSVSYRHLLSDYLDCFATDVYALLSGNVIPPAFSSSAALHGAAGAAARAGAGAGLSGAAVFGLPRVDTLREVLVGLNLNLPEDLLLDVASASSSSSSSSTISLLGGTASLDAQQAAESDKVAASAALRAAHRQRVKRSVLLRLLRSLPLRDARPGPRPALLEHVLSLIDLNEGLSAALGSAIPLGQLMQPLGLGADATAAATNAFASPLGAGAAAAAFGSVALPSRYASVQTPLGPRVSLGSTPLQWYQCYDLQVIRSLLHLATARSAGSVLRPLLTQVKTQASAGATTMMGGRGVFDRATSATNLSAAIGLANETMRSANLTGSMLRTASTAGGDAMAGDGDDNAAAGGNPAIAAANAAAKSMLLSTLGQAHTRTLLATLAGAAAGVDRGTIGGAATINGGAAAMPGGGAADVDVPAEIAACLRWVIASNTFALQLQAAHRMVSSWCNAVLAIVYSCVPDPDPSTHGDIVLGLPAQLALRDTLFAFASSILGQITGGVEPVPGGDENDNNDDAAAEGERRRRASRPLPFTSDTPLDDTPSLLLQPLTHVLVHLLLLLRQRCPSAPLSGEQVRFLVRSIATLLVTRDGSSALADAQVAPACAGPVRGELYCALLLVWHGALGHPLDQSALPPTLLNHLFGRGTPIGAAGAAAVASGAGFVRRPPPGILLARAQARQYTIPLASAAAYASAANGLVSALEEVGGQLLPFIAADATSDRGAGPTADPNEELGLLAAGIGGAGSGAGGNVVVGMASPWRPLALLLLNSFLSPPSAHATSGLLHTSVSTSAGNATAAALASFLSTEQMRAEHQRRKDKISEAAEKAAGKVVRELVAAAAAAGGGGMSGSSSEGLTSDEDSTGVSNYTVPEEIKVMLTKLRSSWIRQMQAQGIIELLVRGLAQLDADESEAVALLQQARLVRYSAASKRAGAAGANSGYGNAGYGRRRFPGAADAIVLASDPMTGRKRLRLLDGKALPLPIMGSPSASAAGGASTFGGVGTAYGRSIASALAGAASSGADGGNGSGGEGGGDASGGDEEAAWRSLAAGAAADVPLLQASYQYTLQLLATIAAEGQVAGSSSSGNSASPADVFNGAVCLVESGIMGCLQTLRWPIRAQDTVIGTRSLLLVSAANNAANNRSAGSSGADQSQAGGGAAAGAENDEDEGYSPFNANNNAAASDAAAALNSLVAAIGASGLKRVTAAAAGGGAAAGAAYYDDDVAGAGAGSVMMGAGGGGGFAFDEPIAPGASSLGSLSLDPSQQATAGSAAGGGSNVSFKAILRGIWGAGGVDAALADFALNMGLHPALLYTKGILPSATASAVAAVSPGSGGIIPTAGTASSVSALSFEDEVLAAVTTITNAGNNPSNAGAAGSAGGGNGALLSSLAGACASLTQDQLVVSSISHRMAPLLSLLASVRAAKPAANVAHSAAAFEWLRGTHHLLVRTVNAALAPYTTVSALRLARSYVHLLCGIASVPGAMELACSNASNSSSSSSSSSSSGGGDIGVISSRAGVGAQINAESLSLSLSNMITFTSSLAGTGGFGSTAAGGGDFSSSTAAGNANGGSSSSSIVLAAAAGAAASTVGVAPLKAAAATSPLDPVYADVLILQLLTRFGGQQPRADVGAQVSMQLHLERVRVNDDCDMDLALQLLTDYGVPSAAAAASSSSSASASSANSGNNAGSALSLFGGAGARNRPGAATQLALLAEQLMLMPSNLSSSSNVGGSSSGGVGPSSLLSEYHGMARGMAAGGSSSASASSAGSMDFSLGAAGGGVNPLTTAAAAAAASAGSAGQAGATARFLWYANVLAVTPEEKRAACNPLLSSDALRLVPANPTPSMSSGGPFLRGNGPDALSSAAVASGAAGFGQFQQGAFAGGGGTVAALRAHAAALSASTGGLGGLYGGSGRGNNSSVAALMGGGRVTGPLAGAYSRFDVVGAQAGEALVASAAAYLRTRSTQWLLKPAGSNNSSSSGAGDEAGNINGSSRSSPILFRDPSEAMDDSAALPSLQSALAAASAGAKGAFPSIWRLMAAIEQAALALYHSKGQFESASARLQELLARQLRLSVEAGSSGGRHPAVSNVAQGYSSAAVHAALKACILRAVAALRNAASGMLCARYTFENLLGCWLSHSSSRSELRFDAEAVHTLTTSPAAVAEAYESSEFAKAVVRQLKVLGSSGAGNNNNNQNPAASYYGGSRLF